MKHRLISKVADLHPYEIVKIELLADTKEESELINNYSEQTENYLTISLQAVDIIEQNPPYFKIKKVKDNVGFGQ